MAVVRSKVCPRKFLPEFLAGISWRNFLAQFPAGISWRKFMPELAKNQCEIQCGEGDFLGEKFGPPL
jgi:hypothetical protein